MHRTRTFILAALALAGLAFTVTADEAGKAAKAANAANAVKAPEAVTAAAAKLAGDAAVTYTQQTVDKVAVYRASWGKDVALLLADGTLLEHEAPLAADAVPAAVAKAAGAKLPAGAVTWTRVRVVHYAAEARVGSTEHEAIVSGTGVVVHYEKEDEDGDDDADDDDGDDDDEDDADDDDDDDDEEETEEPIEATKVPAAARKAALARLPQTAGLEVAWERKTFVRYRARVEVQGSAQEILLTARGTQAK